MFHYKYQGSGPSFSQDDFVLYSPTYVFVKHLFHHSCEPFWFQISNIDDHWVMFHTKNIGLGLVVSGKMISEILF